MHGGGSSIVKVPGDVPPARLCFFKPSSLAKGILSANFSSFSLAKGILFANFRPFSLGKGIFLAILVKELSNFGQILVLRMQKFGKKMPTHGTFDVGISLAKGIIFRKIGLANGAISKLWAAHPCPKFSREPPPPWFGGFTKTDHPKYTYIRAIARDMNASFGRL